jgi:hypothetical protein
MGLALEFGYLDNMRRTLGTNCTRLGYLRDLDEETIKKIGQTPHCSQKMKSWAREETLQIVVIRLLQISSTAKQTPKTKELKTQGTRSGVPAGDPRVYA